PASASRCRVWTTLAPARAALLWSAGWHGLDLGGSASLMLHSMPETKRGAEAPREFMWRKIGYGRRASSGSSLVTGIRSRLDTPRCRIIGLAMKIDDSVPTRMPIIMIRPKLSKAGPPRKYSVPTASSVVELVMIV